MLSRLVHIFFAVIYLDIIIVVLLSWIPIFNVRKQPIASLVAFYEKIMTPLRGIIPPIAGIDFSPMIVFILLQVTENLITTILGRVGL